jgi:photosystem II stability/assembly factor-like uncharacterized protein
VVVCLAPDPRVGGGFFAGTQVSLFASADVGLHWTPTGLGTVTPFGASALAADSSGAILAGTSTGIFRSSDSGVTWAARNVGLAHQNVASIALQPGTGWLYLGATTGGLYPTGALYRSKNDGETWQQIVSFPSQFVPSQIAFDASSSSILYLSTTLLDRFNPEAGVATSRDGGATWRTSNLPTFPNYGPMPLVADPTVSGTIYAGAGFLYRSSDFGSTWTAVGDTSRMLAFRSLAFSSGALYAATDVGVLRSQDRGLTWTSLLAADATGLAFGSNGALMTAVHDGVEVTQDGGATWKTSDTGLIGTRISGLVLDPSSSSHAWTSTALDTRSGPELGIFETHDGGSTWVPVTASPQPPPALLAADPFSQGKLYGLLDDCAGVAISEDGGRTWTSTTIAPGCWSVAADPAIPNVAYAAGGGPLLKTTDGGATWTQPNPSFDSASAVTVDPRGNGRLYAWSSFAGPYRSDDGGTTWKTINSVAPGLSLPYVNQIAIDPAQPETLYAAAGANGVYRSFNGGEVWEFVGAGVGLSYAVSVAVNPSGGAVFVGGDGGVLVSSDQGASWKPFNQGLWARGVLQLAMDSRGRFLHLATNGAGVFDLEFAPSRAPVQPAVNLRRTRTISRD